MVSPDRVGVLKERAKSLDNPLKSQGTPERELKNAGNDVQLLLLYLGVYRNSSILQETLSRIDSLRRMVVDYQQYLDDKEPMPAEEGVEG